MAEDDRIRSLYAEQAADPGQAHLGEDDWLDLASGALAAPERARAVEHVVRCAACAQVYRGLSELEEEARRFDRAVPQSIGRAPLGVWQTTRWGWWAGLATAAALVWAIAQPRQALAPAPEPTGSELRGPSDSRPVLLEPVGALTLWPERLRWEPVAGSRGYRVRILGREGDLLWSSPLVTGTTLPWPAAVAARPGRVYWQVTAYAADRGPADGVASTLASFDFEAGR